MNWKTVIADIQRHGKMTQPQIAEKVGCSQATISDLVNSKTDQPRYPLGAALIELLHAVTPKATASLDADKAAA